MYVLLFIKLILVEKFTGIATCDGSNQTAQLQIPVRILRCYETIDIGVAPITQLRTCVMK